MKKLLCFVAMSIVLMSCGKDEPNPVIHVPKAVDLGLSVKWAEFNVGADNIAAYGGLYGWGDSEGNHRSLDGIKIEPFDIHTSTMKVDWTSPYYGGINPPDNISGTALDVATCKLGNGWRTPTDNEMQELMTKCQWTHEIQGKTQGCRVTGPNGNSIFLPLAGYCEAGSSISELNVFGFYWTSNLIPKSDQDMLGFDGNVACAAYALSLSLLGHAKGTWTHQLRCNRLSIRPVQDK